jgi:outer membrane lipoprotein-sorting protein
MFPQEIKIYIKRGIEQTTIDFTLKKIEINTKINTSFSIPKGYKRIYKK